MEWRNKLRYIIKIMDERNNTSAQQNNIMPEDTFFNVSLCRLYWEDEQSNDGFFAPRAKKILCSDFLAVVNMDSKQVYV